jgi:hypothetical protein
VILTYYRFHKLGLTHHNLSAISLFSILIKQDNKQYQLNILDISGSPPNSFPNDIFPKETSTTLLVSIGHLNDIYSIQHMLEVTSNSKKISSKVDSFLRQTILKTTQELYHDRSTSPVSSLGEPDPKDHSTFSSISNYTHLTIPDDGILDLNRQVEELQNQLITTRERNAHVEQELMVRHQAHTNLVEHLMSVQCAQDELVGVLEENWQEAERRRAQLEDGLRNLIRDLDNLSLDRHQLTQMFSIVERRLFTNDRHTEKALEELELIKIDWRKQELIKKLDHNGNNNRNEEVEQIELLRSQRDRFYHQWKQHLQLSEKTQQALESQTARCTNLEQEKDELQKELNISRELLKEQDTSGMIQKLERELERIMDQKRAEKEEFETGYELALNEIKSMKTVIDQQTETITCLQSATRLLHQQLNDSTERNMARRNSGCSIVSTYGDANLAVIQEKIEQEEIIKRLSMENSNLKSVMANTESQMAIQRQQIHTLERDIITLSTINSQRNSQHSVELCSRPRSARASSVSSHPRNKDRDSFDTVIPVDAGRPSSTGVLPPPSNPPSQPIPPLPPTSPEPDRNKTPISIREDSLAHLEIKIQQQQQEIDGLLEQQALSSKKLEMAQIEIEQRKKELEDETRRKVKAERAREILEKRMQDVMNKKSKYLCF